MFTDYFFPELGGIQDSIATISRALGRRGHHVDIYAPRYGKRDYRVIGVQAQERDLGANVRIRRRPSVAFPSSTRQSRAAVLSPLGWAGLAGRRKPDVIHTHSFFGIGLEAVLNGACLRVPVVGTNHTTVAGLGPHIPVSVARASAYVSWFYNRCDVVTAPSRSVFEELGLARLRRPHRVISNPIDTALFVPLRPGEEAALRQHFALSRPTIAYAGRLGAEKNIDVVLQALAVLRDNGIVADLALAGHGAHEPILRALAADLGLADQVKFLGTLTQDDLARLLRISDLFVMMSTSETQSMALLQAMATGLPVVAAASRALPEFVDPDNGVLVDPDDSAGLAAAFRDLLTVPARRRQLGAAGRRSVEKYGVDAVTDTWESLYGSVLRRRSAA